MTSTVCIFNELVNASYEQVFKIKIKGYCGKNK